MIPVVEDLKSSPMVHRFGDLFNPPGLTNFMGCVQTDVDPVAIVRDAHIAPAEVAEPLAEGEMEVERQGSR